MSQLVSNNEDAYAAREIPLGGDLHAYVAVVSRRAPGTIAFRTGAGRLLRDLLLHWPMVEDWEVEAQELCQRITDAVYPLVGELYAQAVEIAVTISPTPILAPEKIDAMSTCVVFDTEKRIERTLFLSPERPLPAADLMGAKKGIVALCKPLHYRYHAIKDDRKQIGRPHIGMFELPQRLINELYEKPDFVPREHAIIGALMTKIQELPQKILGDAALSDVNLTLQQQADQTSSRPLPVIPAISSLSILPPAILYLERILLSYIMDPSLSPELRFRLRYISQIMRSLYPRALIEEAARSETARPALKVAPQVRPAVSATPVLEQATAVIPKGFPKAVPVAPVGKLGKTVNMKSAQTPHAPQQKPHSGAFLAPGPMFTGDK